MRKGNPPTVFEGSKDDIVLMQQETSAMGSYVASIPPGMVTEAFEGAWLSITCDMPFAQYFETQEQAQTAFDSRPPRLTHREFILIHDGLRKLRDKLAARNRLDCSL
jgi:hypothetical protein